MKLISSSLASLSFDSLKSLAEYIDSIYLRSGFDSEDTEFAVSVP